MVLIKVHSFAIPMGSHGLHWSLCLFKIICYWLKGYNTIKCKMLCNFSILSGMDVSCAVDCGDTWLPGCIKGTRDNRSQRIQWGLVVSWVRMKLYTYVVRSLCVFQFWRGWRLISINSTCNYLTGKMKTFWKRQSIFVSFYSVFHYSSVPIISLFL